MNASGVRGHDAARAVLRALDAHTLLFVGPDGVGRRRVARWYARLRNCGASGDEPCGRCPSCRAFADDRHPDYREVGPRETTARGRSKRDPEIVIDQLVARPQGEPDPLGPWLERRPAYRLRVGVIDRAETLTQAAANAFLKMLEEPPSYARIVLIAPSPQALLPTIASRAAVVRFGTVALDPEAYPDLPGHPALRLGQYGALERARADADGYAAARDSVTSYLRALPRGLEEALEAADGFEKSWLAAGDLVPSLLREGLRGAPVSVQAEASDALDRCADALAAYAAAGLAVQVLTLELRALLRAAGVRDLGSGSGGAA